jgi:preprotein translocase subunit YajC
MLLAAAKSSAANGAGYIQLVMLLALGLFWYFVIRPRNKRLREQRLATRQFEIGDQVQTIGGIIGVVTDIANSEVTIRTTTGVSLAFTARAIAGKYETPAVSDTPNEAASEEEGK